MQLGCQVFRTPDREKYPVRERAHTEANQIAEAARSKDANCERSAEPWRDRERQTDQDTEQPGDNGSPIHPSLVEVAAGRGGNGASWRAGARSYCRIGHDEASAGPKADCT